MPDQRSGSRATTAARVLVLAALLALCVAPGARAAEPYSLGPGDLMQITVYAGGEKQVDFTGYVSALGTITSPLIGEFKVAGLTTWPSANSRSNVAR